MIMAVYIQWLIRLLALCIVTFLSKLRIQKWWPCSAYSSVVFWSGNSRQKDLEGFVCYNKSPLAAGHSQTTMLDKLGAQIWAQVVNMVNCKRSLKVEIENPWVQREHLQMLVCWKETSWRTMRKGNRSSGSWCHVFRFNVLSYGSQDRTLPSWDCGALAFICKQFSFKG